jgi:deoxyribose-phosphate aldolase
MSSQADCSSAQAISADPQCLAQWIDHTKLTFGADENETVAIQQLCAEARSANFYVVCVRPQHVVLAKSYLSGSAVKVATVIGFPVQKVALTAERQQPTIGSFSTPDKLAEIHQALINGADELDVVINVAALKQDVKDDGQRVLQELQQMVSLAGLVPIKVIIEIDLLSDAEIGQATRWCAQAGAAMVKTSTGMVEGGQGATLPAVQLIADTLRHMNAALGIKASGGIKTREQALAFVRAGVSRIGTSSGLAIVQGVLLQESSVY